ncbi:MAG: MFS transporter, partial [Clostridia bacterium]|nr:MFS transporter [Clostridia bacterium]
GGGSPGAEADFRKLWVGRTVSLAGSQVSQLALPLTAVGLLHASAWQMGLLEAAGSLPWLLFALPAGVWVDRRPHRPVMVAADAGRALLVAAVVLAVLLHRLRLPLLYAVALATGSLTVLFDLADHAYLPGLVGRERLVEANGRLQLSQSLAMLAGPGLAGFLVQAVGAPRALVVDALSYLVSAAALLFIQKAESPPAATGGPLAGELRQGLETVFRHPLLRALVGYAATLNLVDGMLMAVLILFLTRELGLRPGEIGLGLSMGAVGGVLGALAAGRLGRRAGVTRSLRLAALLHSAGLALLPAASGPHAARLAVGTSAAFLVLMASTASNTLTVSLRQAVTPDRLLARVTASVRVVIWGVGPLAALAGGALGHALGLRPTLLVVAAGSLLAFPWLYLPPLGRLERVPEMR